VSVLDTINLSSHDSRCRDELGARAAAEKVWMSFSLQARYQTRVNDTGGQGTGGLSASSGLLEGIGQAAQPRLQGLTLPSPLRTYPEASCAMTIELV